MLKYPVLLILLFLPARTSASGPGGDYTDAGLRYTSGPGGYSGLGASAEWGNESYYLRPSLNTYSSEGEDRYSSCSFSGGLDRKRWSASAGLSLAPETGGYSNSAVYADLLWTPLGEPADGAALEDLYFGVSASLTAHEDLYSSSVTVSGTGRRSSVSSRDSAFRLSQYDYGVSASVRALGVRLSGRFTLTSYDKDVTEEARALPVDIGSIGSRGFPDSSVSLRLSLPLVPLSPWAGYSRTRYLLEQPSSEGLQCGVSLTAGPARLSASWEGVRSGTSGPDDYWSLGLNWSF